MLSIKQTNPKNSWLIDIIFISIVLGIFYAAFIGGHALFTPDEGRYSEVAREMVASGDYITPRLDGVAFLDKPALYYWLQASAIKLFGIQEWALRFWPAFMGVLGCLMAYFTGRALFNRRSGILAALMLATAPLYYGAAHYANLDLEVGVLISITLSFSLLALQAASEHKRTLFFITAYTFAGLAVLTKGLIGIAFPAMIIGSWILALNRWAILKKMHLLTGFIIFAAIVLPWYYLVQKANPEFLHFFFITQQIARFLTHGDYNNRTYFWFYAPVILGGFFPWSVFLIQTLIKNCKAIWQNRQQHTNELFLILWFSIIFIFFSIPKSKTVGYIIPVFFPLALMMGNYLDGIWGNIKNKGFVRGIKAFVAFSLFTAIACVIASQVNSPKYIYPGSTPYLFFAAAAFVLSAITSWYFFQKETFKHILVSLGIFSITGLLTLLASTTVINKNSIKQLALQLKEHVKPSDEVVAYLRYYQDLPIYLEKKVTIVADWNSPDIAKNDNWQRELWYGMPFQNTKDWLINENTFWQRWYSNKHIYVVMNEKNYQAFSAKAKNSIRQIGRVNDTTWVSNH